MPYDTSLAIINGSASRAMERPTKLRKLDDESHSPSTTVRRPDDIHQWLEFIQSTDHTVKEGINNFKNYLASIPRLDDLAEQSKQLRYLKEYCEWQRAPSDDQLHFYDLLQTWSFAVDNNAEAIISAVPAALAQFLRSISGFLEFRSFGLALVDTLLRRDQSKLFERCLVSPRSKPHLASPCVRLLTEMLSFDAGARADAFWARRDLFIHKFDALLEQQNSTQDLNERRKPSVRRMALRLFLSMSRYLDSMAKTSFLTQARAFHACLRGLTNDGDDIIVDILSSLNQHIVLDKDIPRGAIVRLFNSSHLDSLATLYRYNVDSEDVDVTEVVRQAAHKTLVVLCTTEQGIVMPDSGWYPSHISQLRIPPVDDNSINLGLDSLYHDDSVTRPSLSNTTLSLFLQRLRPREDVLQSQLVLATLSASPELTVDYFSKCKPLPPAASDDVLWRSTLAFLFSVIDSPVPEAFGWRDGVPQYPPSPTMTVESILPKPLDRNYATKLLSSADDILKISGARVVTVVLKKLDKVLSSFSRYPHSNIYMWDQASSRIMNLMQSKLPPVREVLLAFQHTPHQSTAAYTALLECIATYYEVLPEVATTSSFDVSPVMSDLCKTLDKQDVDSDDTASTMEQLTHAVRIADRSSSTRWLHKANNDVLSPLGQVLRTTLTTTSLHESKIVAGILGKVLKHRGIIHTSQQSFTALLTSLKTSKKFHPSFELFLFLDNCIVRANQKPVRYLDEMEKASQILSDKKPLSLYAGAIAEQWSYACKKYEGDKSAIKTIAMWIARIFTLLDSAGENYRVMMHFQETMIEDTKGKPKEYLQDAFDKARKRPMSLDADIDMLIDNTSTSNETNIEAIQSQSSSAAITTELPASNSLHNLLIKTRIATTFPNDLPTLPTNNIDIDIPLEIQTKRLPDLLLCTSSPISELRLQSFQTIQSLTFTLDTMSTYEGKSQVYLLLGELLESLRRYGLDRPPPSIFPQLAIMSLDVLIDPTHGMYGKVNRFLLSAPSWTPRRLLSHWLERILTSEPDEHDSVGVGGHGNVNGYGNTHNNDTTSDSPTPFQSEVTWLLTWLLRSLNNEVDIDLYRRSGLWERVLALYSAPVITSHIRDLVLAMLCRACDIPGGADILCTRFGVLTWIEAVNGVGGGGGGREKERELKYVKERVMEGCNSGMIAQWKLACSANRKTKGLEM